MITPPIIFVDGHDVSIFSSVEAAERSLEPQDIDDPATSIYDAEGRLLKYALSRRTQDTWATRWFGLRRQFTGITLESAEDPPQHADELRERLCRLLAYHDYPIDILEKKTLQQLVQKSLEYSEL